MFTIPQAVAFKGFGLHFRLSSHQPVCRGFHHNLACLTGSAHKGKAHTTFHLLRIDADAADGIAYQHSLTGNADGDLLT